MATTTDLYAIASDETFQGRVKYAVTKRALARFASSPTPDERALIQRVLAGSSPIGQWSIAVVTDATIAAGTHTLDGSTITDSAIDTAVQTIWASFVG